MIKKFGIIGNPIKHSLSPFLHNYWFKKYNVNASYSIIDMEENNLEQKGPIWELYVNDPTDVKPADIQTDTYYPVE